MLKKRKITDTEFRPAKKIGRKLTRGQTRSNRKKLVKKKRVDALRKPPVSVEDLLAASRAIDAIVDGRDIPAVGLDTERIRRIMRGLRPRGNRIPRNLDKAEAENVALWIRRLLIADLWAQGWTPAEIARQFNITQRAVRHDLKQLAQWKMLAGTAEQANITILKTLNRLEQLQRSAFQDLTRLGEDAYVTRAELRKEIESRELRALETVRVLGFLRAVEPEEEKKPDKPSVQVNVGVKVEAPVPDKPFEDMQNEELMEHMEQYVAHIRSKNLNVDAEEVYYEEVSDIQSEPTEAGKGKLLEEAKATKEGED